MSRPTLEVLTGSSAASHSSIDTWMRCGEQYRLTRVMRVEQDQAWYFMGGTAVHLATEKYDRGDARSLREIWDEAWAEATKDYDPSRPTRAGGKVTKSNPHKEDAAWWGLQGPVMFENYIRWRDATRYEILDIDGEPAIEYGFTLTLPNPDKSEDASPDISIRGFIDRVFVTPNGEVTIVDLKTGQRESVSSLQLGIYAAGLRPTGYQAHLGAYYLARHGRLGQIRSLSQYTDEFIAYMVSKFETSVRSQVFLPNVNSMCNYCNVSKYCYAVGGTPPQGLPFQSSNVT